MSTSTMTPIQAHEQIERCAKSAKADPITVDSIAVGEFCRQGDIYLMRIRSVNKSWAKTDNRQLAPGSSAGSRHVVTAGPTLFDAPGTNAREVTRHGVRLLGPQISADKTFTVIHPEHAHVTLPPGNYQVSYQLDFHKQRAVRD
jgi:hypothetical protein